MDKVMILFDNWKDVIDAIAYIVLGASVLAKVLTPWTDADDKIVARVKKILDAIAINSSPKDSKK